MDIKKQIKINHLIYLFLLKEFGEINQRFVDALVHIYRYIRLERKWRIDKTFVSIDYSIVDPEKEQIIDCLKFHHLIDSDLSLTLRGLQYLQEELKKNPELNEVLTYYKNNLCGKTGYEDTCLSLSSPTAANCGICKKIECKENKNLFTLLFQYLQIPNYQRSFSKS